jgi:hypothetical protein
MVTVVPAGTRVPARDDGENPQALAQPVTVNRGSRPAVRTARSADGWEDSSTGAREQVLESAQNSSFG